MVPTYSNLSTAGPSHLGLKRRWHRLFFRIWASKLAGAIGKETWNEPFGDDYTQRAASFAVYFGPNCMVMWLWVKNTYPKWNPGKWKQGLKPGVLWWIHFDPYPYNLFEERGSNAQVHFSCPNLQAQQWLPQGPVGPCWAMHWRGLLQNIFFDLQRLNMTPGHEFY